MSFPIQTQSQQYSGFADDVTHYAQRDHVAVFDVDGDVHDYLAGPSIHAGLNNTRHGAYGVPYPESGEGGGEFDHERARMDDEWGLNRTPPPPDDPYGGAGHEGHGHEEQAMGNHYEDYDPHSSENLEGYFNDPAPAPPPKPNMGDWDLPSFNTARRRTADDGGSDFQAFQPNLYSPGDRLDAKSALPGGEPERWPTAAAVGPAQPAPPADPVWLGHTYVPGHRVGMPWHDSVLPGTVTHLEGTNVGVRWDDGQHSSEEAGAIQPLY